MGNTAPVFSGSSFDDILTALRHPELGVLIRHWCDLYEQQGTLPKRVSLDPIQFAAALPYVWVMENRDGNYEFRLAGEHLTSWFGETPAKKPLWQFADRGAENTIGGILGAVCGTPAVVWGHGHGPLAPGGLAIDYERIGLPLCDREGVCRYAIGALVMERDDDDYADMAVNDSHREMEIPV